MGISGLLPLLKSIQRPAHIREWAGQTVGIDTYGWLHKGAISCAVDLALNNPTTKYVDYVMNKVRMLKHFGVTPYMIFDGDYLPSKAGTEADRARRRAASRMAGLEMLKLGRSGMAHLELQKAVDITPEMARHVIDACVRDGVQCVVAPYEADSQLYYLEKTGVIDAVLSEDSDLLVFGVRCLLTKIDQYGALVELSRERFTACTEVSLAGWSDADFRVMCILSGCDYLDNIPKMGLKTAHRLVRRHKTVDRVIRAVQLDGTKVVPKGYLEAFERADLTFRHQRVFCPRAQRLVFCNDPDAPLPDESMQYIGPDVPPEIAQAVARGDLCPMTKLPIVTRPPGTRQRPNWTPARPPPPPPGPPKNTKAITTFFKPSASPRTPLAAKDLNARAQPHTAPAAEAPLKKMPTWPTTPVFLKKRAAPATEAPPYKRPCFAPSRPVAKAQSVSSTPMAASTPVRKLEVKDEGEDEVSPFFVDKKPRRAPPKEALTVKETKETSVSIKAFSYCVPTPTPTRAAPPPMAARNAPTPTPTRAAPPPMAPRNAPTPTPVRTRPAPIPKPAPIRTLSAITAAPGAHQRPTCLQRLGANAMARRSVSGPVALLSTVTNTTTTTTTSRSTTTKSLSSTSSTTKKMETKPGLGQRQKSGIGIDSDSSQDSVLDSGFVSAESSFSAGAGASGFEERFGGSFKGGSEDWLKELDEDRVRGVFDRFRRPS
ncbi:putative exonuclease [Geopyxis carbonaria]|nr:putative exonuclease [Geopyxis carbonaria]